MRGSVVGRFRVVAVLAVAVFLAVIAWMALAGGPAELATSGQDGIEVTSPGGVATFEGELRRP